MELLPAIFYNEAKKLTKLILFIVLKSDEIQKKIFRDLAAFNHFHGVLSIRNRL